MKKKIDFAFRKRIYLIGKDRNSINRWLEEPSWDCSWYWGFGYIEEYTNNKCPNKSRDISSHSHVNSNGLNGITEWTMNRDERIKFNTLFNQFYALRKQADSYHQTDRDKWIKLNTIDIPEVMNQIIKIVTPEGVEPIIYSITISE